ncbi:MAG: hypothetical protein HY816_04570 [Candidatus Wallbacteria bacterium]|nr:hypothetical protein [Candidatus Wallbacteria bacterium]
MDASSRAVPSARARAPGSGDARHGLWLVALAVTAAVGLAVLFASFGRAQADPGRLERTPEQLAHVRSVLDSMLSALAS